nr:hypothetical protein [Actinomycetota bacterium]
MRRLFPALIGAGIAGAALVVMTGAGWRIMLLVGVAAGIITIVVVATGAGSSSGELDLARREESPPPRQEPAASPPRREPSRRSHLVFMSFFGLFVASVVVWLLLGLVPAIASALPSLHDRLHDWGRGSGVVSELAENIARASHGAGSPGQVVLDYLFSVFNICLGLFLIYLRPHEITARLLAVGMIGTSVAFNLQGHDAFQVLPTSTLGVVDLWHLLVHIGAGVAYIYALLLFPTGNLLKSRHLQALQVPFLVLVTVAAALLSLLTVEDHVVGLVVVFGIVTPIAGVSSQLRRFRRAESPRERQQSKLLVWALLLSLGAAAVLLIFTSAFGSEARQVERDYEFTTPPPGTYFFRCDPHSATMKGEVIVTPGAGGDGQSVVSIAAIDGKFDKNQLVLPADRQLTLEFTNKDADLHNVAIYQSASAEEPVFIGAEFSGRNTAILAFRIFRIIVAVIPIALLVGLLHFRLWEIDRVINRALVYTILSGILAAVYIGVILLLSRVFFADKRTPDFVVVGSTLAVAALFRPVRDRVQRFIDRRFYRRKYDATKTVEAFSYRAREQVDLDALTAELIGVVQETMQPKDISLWLCSIAEAPRESSESTEVKTS